MMTLTEQLKYPFPNEAIHWRVGATTKAKDKGIALAYIDARDVMERLDDVMGDGWQCRYSHSGPQGTICEIGLLIDGEWRWRADGAGETDYEGTKGAMSDAFKRAAVRWGVGQYLYALKNEWVPISEAGRSYKIATPPNLPKWAIPDPPLYRLRELWRVTEENMGYVTEIKEGIETGDYAHAGRSWFTLDKEIKNALWVAPTKGGIFTTQERNIIRSPEFREAYEATET